MLEIYVVVTGHPGLALISLLQLLLYSQKNVYFLDSSLKCCVFIFTFSFKIIFIFY